VDLAPTLAARVGLERDPSWVGRSLLDLGAERTLFGDARDGGGRYLAVWRGAHKLLAQDPGSAGDGPASPGALDLRRELSAAYDLEADPLERQSLLERAEWPRRLADEVEALWQAVDRPLVDSDPVLLDESKRDELDQLGYGGGG